ncbi:phosphotransferase [Desulfosporosinus sp. PR]|uniref:phosphotransferase enzyme family protein n=1 Tax=Candidatus Desulfosporosinus nitrosoreducens TaxID=3401928 RepID=UPI0027FABED9|nr:phosphotransferase [Desulfosporosinus sp. PR]MDQ7093535.1 phosphotransferase [Desulfosporosinus sp. PR]
MSINEFRERMYTRWGIESLPSHLESLYGIRIAQATKLDLGIFRIDRHDGPSWLARLFPKAMPLEQIQGDAEILSYLEQHNYPAERCALPDSVFMHEEQPVLITDFVAGTKPKGSAKAFYFAGILLGRLHTLPLASGAMSRKGGAWHHLAVQGGPREEIEAAQSFVLSSEQNVSIEERSHYETLLNELRQLDDLHDMPQALIHPDFVPSNMIKVEVGNWAVIDWSGAGRGPRIFSLGFLLWAAGLRGDLQCVDAVVTGYRKYINLDIDELKRLAKAIGFRPLIWDCWAFSMGRKTLIEAAQGVSLTREITKAITDRSMQAFKNFT